MPTATRREADICIIGAGAGGLSVAAGAAQMGARTVLIEADRMGGDCLHTGCVPSKSLIAAAAAAQAVREAGRFGIRTAPPEVD
ncbi:MAG TPA: dihydrolipoamide dehydrogenase, partial [Rhodospirillales bacterium]|nr:dihydrolipoamide dehydrogenase [Rhodospirillales bacterium]